MKSHYRQMTYARAQAIRAHYWNDGWTQARIASLYGVGQNTVSRIIQESCGFRRLLNPGRT